MKTLIFLCLSSLTALAVNARAACQHLPLTDQKAVRAARFIKSIAGYYESKDCKMTIEVCEEVPVPVRDQSARLGSTVGHILVVDSQGKESYLPLDFQTTQVRRTRYEIQNGSRMFHYEYFDSNPDPEGRKQDVYYFEAVKKSDLSGLKYIELGILEYPHKKVQWTTCSFVEK